MRRQLVTLTFAALAIMTSASGTPAAASDEPAVGAPAVAVQRVAVTLPALRDEAAMVLVGAVLIGLGAAVRRV